MIWRSTSGKFGNSFGDGWGCRVCIDPYMKESIAGKRSFLYRENAAASHWTTTKKHKTTNTMISSDEAKADMKLCILQKQQHSLTQRDLWRLCTKLFTIWWLRFCSNSPMLFYQISRFLMPNMQCANYILRCSLSTDT